MNTGVHRGFLRKYGGFMFKQWKEKYVVLTAEGSLLVCRDSDDCETIAEGRDILDLPKLPAGARRDCCFALILPQNKFLLLLSDNPDDCNLWLNLIRKVREGVMSPMTLQRQRSITPCITDRDSLPDSCSDKDPGSPKLCDTPPLSRLGDRGGSLREQSQVNGVRRPLRSVSVAPPHRVSDCLRHGNSSDARAVRAVCLLMGGAAASSALGYLNSCAPPPPLTINRPPEISSGSGASLSFLRGVPSTPAARTVKSNSKLPPGPFALPVVGNLPFMDRNAPYKSFMEYSKTYGPVMTVYLGWQRAVVLVGYDAVKEALVDQGEDFIGRAPLNLFKKATRGYGLAISNGERWTQLRRFTLTTLRDFGMGRKAVEVWIQEESKHMIARINTFNGKLFDPTFIFSHTVSNVICCLVFGERFHYENKQFLQLVKTFNDFITLSSTPFGQLYNIVPWVMDHLPGPHHTVFASVEEVRAFCKEKIDEHLKTLDPNSPRDYIDCFLIRMNQEKENPNTEFHFENMWSTVLNLFAAGTETTSSTIRYALSVLIKYPNIQNRMQEEIDNVIGRERCPSMEDRKSLPFTDAVIHEVQRFIDLVPLSVPRCAIKDITFRGYTIPKGTLIFSVLHSVLKGEQHWATPFAFNPEHFLDRNGNFKKNPAFMPFATGKRSCVGESLARMELFLFIVSLLQHFTFSCSGGPDSIKLTPETGGFANCRALRRKAMDLYTTVILGALVLVLFWICSVKSNSKLPPGPLALPIVGNLPFMDKHAPHKSIMQYSRTYGPVMTMYLGWQRVVVLVGYDAVKEALVDQGEDFYGRAPIHFLYRATRGYGVGISNGERWRQLRRFTLTTLRDFGMGRKPMEAWIQEESKHMIARINTFNGKPFDPTFILSQAVSNVICCLVFGERFLCEDKQFLRLLQILNSFGKFNSSPYGQLYSIFPWLMDRLPGPHHTMFANIDEVRAFNKKKIEEHMKTLDPNSPRDYIDCFLIRMNQEKENPNTEFHFENMWSTVLNLFAAGTETTSSTIRYALSVLIKYPNIQKRIQEETDTVIGQERSPNMEDRKSLPFTDAVIHEVQRCLDLVPFNLPHYALKDITFRGYTIPKGTFIFPMLHSVLKEKKQWATPFTFNPEHFLDQNGNFKKNPAFMPFSAGKRSCVGESLARMELLIFIVSLLQRFTFSCSGGPDKINLSPETSGFGNLPRRYEIIATPR
ncbi:hypothetical protein WMY93_029226 [Mugilogobius chulae]|uniref:PH domain-containing protein n=1 Tax=Mugilogobius chulae TaxID=88201 RepID=A0AAW0N0V6_9GOBI